MKKKLGSKLIHVALVALVILGAGMAASHKKNHEPAAAQNQNPTVSTGKNGRKVTKHKSQVSSSSDLQTTKDIAKIAPRQSQIVNQVSEKKRYYLLSDPNDPKYASQWALSDINAPSAWAVSANSDGVVVADIDTGFALSHEDLTNQWLINSGETGGTSSEGPAPNCTSRSLPLDKSCNNLDDDGNGYIDDWRGWDFYHVDNSPQAGSVNPSGSGVDHGTETAGLIGATTNNGVGMASVSGGATIMLLQVMSDDGAGYSDDITAAIYYAVDNGAQVINMSLGTSGDDPAVSDAVDYAVAHDVVVVAAAGNCGNNDQDVCSGQVSGYVTFPASYNKVIAVGAVDQTGARASFSSYGQRVDMVAPGSGSLISTTYTAGNGTSAYATNLYGTSFSSPITAGGAALIRSIRPNSSVDDVRALLMASTQSLSGMSGNFYTRYYGHGLLDIGKSIEVANDLNGSGEVTPTLYQAGSNKGNSQFLASQSFGSGCMVEASTWCTVWLRNTSENYDRFLPYTQTDVNDEAGWTWGGSILEHGEWSIRARQGDTVSNTPSLIFSK